MEPIELEELVRVLGAEPRCLGAGGRVSSVSIDSRQIGAEAAFFALPGTHTDGHRFLDEAIGSGAVVGVASRAWLEAHPVRGGTPLLVVEEPLRALQRLAAWWRGRLDGALLAVTGSNGKTIVKDALVHLLAGRYVAAGSIGSYNSQLGVALALLRIPRRVDFAVLEAGISAPGEMEALREILRPEFGILTNVGLAHVAAFGSREAIAREKLALFRDLPASGWLLVPADLDVGVAAVEALGCPRHRFGRPGASIPFVERAIGTREGFRITLRFPDGDTREVQTGTPSREIASDLEAAAAAAFLLGLEPGSIADGLQGYRPSRTRMEIWRAPAQDITILDDSVSSDPVSVRAALRSLANLSEPQGRRVFVFGGMRELGELKRQEHEAIGRLAAEHAVDHLVLVDGLGMTAATERSYRERRPRGSVAHVSEPERLRQHLEEVLRPGDVVLFKAPRVLAFDRAARELVDAMCPNRLHVDLQAVAENVRVLRRLVGPGTRILGMVKALAYGSDLTRLGLELQKLGVDYLGVASPSEGETLRRAGVDLPILVTLCTPEGARTVAAHQLTPVIYTPGLVEPLAAAARARGRPLPVHLKVDTGLGRLGVGPEEIAALARRTLDAGWLDVVGLMTHFAAAESPAEDAFTKGQIELFEEARRALRDLGLGKLLAHAAATAAAVRFPASRYDMVRIGLGLYGVYPSEAVRREVELTLAVALLSRVSTVRELKPGARIGYGGTYRVTRPGFRAAVLPLGYNDALPWGSSNSGHVLVGGRPAPIVGRVSMDSTTIDVSDIPEAREGSDVLLFGSHDGHTLRPEELAASSGTIVYELLTRIGGFRVQRIFVG